MGKLTFALVTILFIIGLPVAFCAQKSTSTELKKLLYSIRKQTLADLKTYTPPSAKDRIAMRKALDQLLKSDMTTIHESVKKAFAELDFEISQGEKNKKPLTMVHEKQGGYKGGGIYLFRPLASDRCGVLMAPHGFFDVHTSRLSVDAFFRTDATALLLNSAHRYTGNRKAKSDKYGSDLAHRTDNHYYSVFTALTENCKKGSFIQLHGYGEGGVNVPDPTFDVIVSGGDIAGTAVSVAQRAAKILAPALPGAKIAVYGKQIRSVLGGRTNIHNKTLHRLPGKDFIHIEMKTPIREHLVEDKKAAGRFFEAIDNILKAEPLS